MTDQIMLNLENPSQLEKLYRADKSAYKRAFNALYPGLKDSTIATVWHERLNFGKEEIAWDTSRDWIFVLVASTIAGLIAKLPEILSIDEEFFYQRNIGFIVFPALAAFFAWKHKLSVKKIAVIAGAISGAAIFINLLPDVKSSDTLMLSCIHVVLVLWSVLGFAFVGQAGYTTGRRLDFLRYNGDLVVMTGLILIAGGVLTAVTIGLFNLIGFKIDNFYFQYIVVFGLAAAPIVGTYLTQSNPQLVGKVSPVIAKIFSPLVLVMLVIYLVAIIYSGKDPYNDREFLLIFNALLIGVMAIIFFSVAGTSTAVKSAPETWVLFLLSIITIIVNGIALSAIIFRIADGGVTANRAAVLGGNLLMLIHLLLVAVRLYRSISKKSGVDGVGDVIAFYLPVYIVWATIVTFLFPVLFGFE